jgi:hypothetical protein
MNEAERQDFVKSLLTGQSLLDHDDEIQYGVVATAFANIQHNKETKKLIADALLRHGYVKPKDNQPSLEEALAAAFPLKSPAQAANKAEIPQVGIGGLVNVLGSLNAEKKPAPKLTQDEFAAKWIVEFGPSEAARRWSEWLINSKQVPSPASVAMFYDKFPATLKKQYNPDRATAIEALRAQMRSWIEKGTTTLKYVKSQVTAEPKQPSNLTEASADLYRKAADAMLKKETAY